MPSTLFMIVLHNILAFYVQFISTRSSLPVEGLGNPVEWKGVQNLNKASDEISYEMDTDCAPVCTNTGFKCCCPFRKDASLCFTFNAECSTKENKKITVSRANGLASSETTKCCSMCYNRTNDICEMLKEINQDSVDSSLTDIDREKAYFVLITMEEKCYVLCRQPTQYILYPILSSKQNPSGLFTWLENYTTSIGFLTNVLHRTFEVEFVPLTKLPEDIQMFKDMEMQILTTSAFRELQKFDFPQDSSMSSSEKPNSNTGIVDTESMTIPYVSQAIAA